MMWSSLPLKHSHSAIHFSIHVQQAELDGWSDSHARGRDDKGAIQRVIDVTQRIH
jgi:hypothetical protein